VAVRAVVRYPAAVLKQRAEELTPGSEAQALCDDLVDTMRASPACVGLAATQIGVGARAFCLDVVNHPKTTTSNGLIVLINPVILSREGADVTREGCMSLPDFTGNVRRSTVVTVRGELPEGETREITTDGFEARALQHEIDHLDGLLFIDRVSSLTADVFARKRYAAPRERPAE
jgi:peptide deformylase